MTSRVQIIKRADGQPEYAILPWAEFEHLSATAARAELSDEEALEIARYESAGYDPVPLETAERIFDGENPVKVYREWRGLKQKTLATEIEISPSYLSEIEKGKAASLKTMVRIAGRLGVPLDALVPAED